MFDVLRVEVDGKTDSFDSSVVKTTSDRIFVPVQPIFDDPEAAEGGEPAEEGKMEDVGTPSLAAEEAAHTDIVIAIHQPRGDLAVRERSAMLNVTDINSLLQEERRSMAAAFDDLRKAFPNPGEGVIATAQELILLTNFLHIGVGPD